MFPQIDHSKPPSGRSTKRRKLLGILPLLCLYLFAFTVTGIIPGRVWEFVFLAPILMICTFFALMHLGGLIFPLIVLITPICRVIRMVGLVGDQVVGR
jgi:hypothetical protein